MNRKTKAAQAAYDSWRRSSPGALPWEALSDAARSSWCAKPVLVEPEPEPIEEPAPVEVEEDDRRDTDRIPFGEA